MRAKIVVPDGVAYNTMIGGFCKIREIEMAIKFFKEMGLSGIKSTCVAYEHHITGYCKIGNLDSAMLLYKDMLRKDIKPKGSTMDVLILVLCDEREVPSGTPIFPTMRGATVDYCFCPTEKSYENLIRGLRAEEKLEETLKLQAEMLGKKGVNRILRSIMSPYMKQGNKEVAERLKIEMLDTQMYGNGSR
ncbi:pentatricopeptide repeat-containing protein At2g15980-like [Pyrus communis]|uniref:pentatricopeptide repeat-containing protein At2g15980-like n=1 Tax=Pyrus communis TaxID=23211 RepID=UPI0035C24BC5